MKIGIDARFYSQTGIGRYLRNLISHLQILDKENEYVIFLLDEDYDKVKIAKNFRKVRANIPWYGVKEQLTLPNLIYSQKLDLMHFPHFNVPLSFNKPFVVTIHDLIHQHHSMVRATTHDMLTFGIKKIGYQLIFNHALKKAKYIITPSRTVKNQLINEWTVNEEKVEVTHEGVEENFIKLSQKTNKQLIDKTLQRLGIKPPFIFYVGNAHPHKNVEGLIEAFLILRKKYQYLQLVLAGKKNYFWERIEKEYQNKDIIYTGFITDEDLVNLYKSAQAFVFPTKEEGFGIPILEAFAVGCPVVAADLEVLHEVGDEACLYFDPQNSSEMAEKIKEVLDSNKLTKELIKKGEAQVKKFSWSHLAQKTLEIYQKCV